MSGKARAFWLDAYGQPLDDRSTPSAAPSLKVPVHHANRVPGGTCSVEVRVVITIQGIDEETED